MNMCQAGNRLGMMGEHMLSSEDMLQLDFLEECFQTIAHGIHIIKSGWRLSLESVTNFLVLMDSGFDV